MKLIARTTCPNGSINEVTIDFCCCSSCSTPPPPGEPDFQFVTNAPDGAAIDPSNRFNLTKELRLLEGLAEFPLVAIGGFSLDDVSSTYGYFADGFISIDECSPGDFPLAALYGNDDVWHSPVKFVRDAANRIFLIPAYAATWLPLDTTRIALTTTNCTPLTDDSSSSQVGA